MPIALADCVGEVGENGNRLQAQLADGGACSRFERLADDPVGALENDGARTLDCRDTHAQVSELQRGSESRVGSFPA